MRVPIRHKILLGVMAIILVVVGGTALALINLMKGIGQREALLSLETAANTYIRYDQQRRDLMLMKASTLAATPILNATLSIPDVDSETIAFSLSQLELVDGDTSVVVVSPDGRLLGATGSLKDLVRSDTQLPGLDAALAGESYYGATAIGHRYFQFAVVPALSGDALVGILLVAVPLDTPANVAALRDATGTEIALFFSDRVVRAEGSSIMSQSNSLAVSLMRRSGELVKEHGNFQMFESVVGSDQYYNIQIPLDQNEGRLFLYRSAELVPSTLVKMRLIIISGSVLGVLLGGIFSFWVSGRISRSIINLADTATRLGNGDMSARATQESGDELGDLALSFNKMADQVVEKQADLVASMEEAEAANRAKSTFLATMSHEIRTPLNGVLGMAEVVAHNIDDPRQLRNLEVINQSGNHLLEVIEDILDFSKIEAGHLELSYGKFRFREFMQDLHKTHRLFAANKGLELILSLPSDFECEVELDEVRLRRVLTNLIHNALKFTERGHVKIAVSVIERSKRNARLQFEVCDTGIGIEASQLDSVFKPFIQADGSATRKYGGSGLGLAISRQLVDLMGGTLEVASEPGAGCQFSFSVECKAMNIGEPAETVHSGSHVPLAASGEGGSRVFGGQSDDNGCVVLVVEDSPLNQEVARAMLEWLGCSVVVAENGIAALEAVQQAEFDLILMDCQMPEMDGLEATRQLRRKEQAESGPHIPIVALTANAVLGDREQCLKAGMDDYITKPFDLESLVDALNKWCTARVGVALKLGGEHARN